MGDSDRTRAANGTVRSKATIISNARIFTSEPGSDELIHNGCVVVQDGRIQHVGSINDQEVATLRAFPVVEEVDAQNRIITPSFLDSHVHIMQFGGSLEKLDLISLKNLEDIRTAIRKFAAERPTAPRLMCRGWLQSTLPGQAMAGMLDDLDPRPIYVEAMDLHSMWLNTAALKESGVMSAKTDPDGGKIHRDADGKPSGLIEEGALLQIVWPFLANALSMDEKQAHLEQAFTAYTQAGYTGIIDMAMDKQTWEALEIYRDAHDLPFHIAAHWLIPYSDSASSIVGHLTEAISMNERYHPTTSPTFCIIGIKIIGDGTVDGCTAGLSAPYGPSKTLVHPIWPYSALERLVHAADAAHLQIAIHAIGDKAISDAIDAIASLPPQSADTPLHQHRRHRIEHLELTSAEDAKRLGQIGITASVQPVHSDPVLFRAWDDLIGSHRCKRAFAYREFLDGGAKLALGTDAPTAPHWPLKNLYNATTRRSALEVESKETVNEEFKLRLADAVRGVSWGGAYSRRAESWCGSLKAGMRADFVVLGFDGDGWSGEQMLDGKVLETWFGGRRVWSEPGAG